MDSLAQEPSVPPLSTPSPEDLLTTLRQTRPHRLQVAASLLDRGVDINGVHEFLKHYPYGGGPKVPRTKVTALYDAAQRGDYEAVQFLLSRGADVRAKNRTGMSMYGGLFPIDNIETLCALDGMRTSKNMRIVQLAEEMYGVETKEEFIRRRDAFDELMKPGYARPTGEFQVKSKMRRVKSVLPKSRAKKSQTRMGHSNGAEKNREKRYDLRSRNSNLFYA